MEVTQLWRYPVKSMIGERVEVIDLDDVGVVGDRTWAARDLERGGIRGGKKIGGLMRLAARDLPGGQVEVSLPDGSTVATTDAAVHDRLSDALGRRLRLERLRPASDTGHYRRGDPDSDDLLTELRTMFGRTDDEPLPDFTAFPADLFNLLMEYESPPGTYYDAYPLLVMTEQALVALQKALPGSSIDPRRFRPSMVVDAPGAPPGSTGHPEFGWAGRQARIGSAVVEFTIPCPRCVMVTRGIDDTVPEDRAVLRHIVADLDQQVGIYASITTPGTIGTGDRLEFL